MQSPSVLLVTRYLPAGQAVQLDKRTVPVLMVVWPDGHCRQDTEAWLGWYWPQAHSTHAPVLLPSQMKWPAGQPVQSDPREVLPVLLVVWPERH